MCVASPTNRPGPTALPGLDAKFPLPCTSLRESPRFVLHEILPRCWKTSLGDGSLRRRQIILDATIIAALCCSPERKLVLQFIERLAAAH